jgi:hypothetical protein
VGHGRNRFCGDDQANTAREAPGDELGGAQQEGKTLKGVTGSDAVWVKVQEAQLDRAATSRSGEQAGWPHRRLSGRELEQQTAAGNARAVDERRELDIRRPDGKTLKARP